jgi:hypothetical protein
VSLDSDSVKRPKAARLGALDGATCGRLSAAPTTSRPKAARLGEPACKPGSVESSHSSMAPVTRRLKRPTRKLVWAHSALPYSVLLRVGFTVPLSVTTSAVRSYRTISPLPDESGGIFSVALAVGSRPPGITWHPAQWSPDFPPGSLPATARPAPGMKLIVCRADRKPRHR